MSTQHYALQPVLAACLGNCNLPSELQFQCCLHVGQIWRGAFARPQLEAVSCCVVSCALACLLFTPAWVVCRLSAVSRSVSGGCTVLSLGPVAPS